MSEFDEKSGFQAGSGTAELQDEVNGLRVLLSISLVLMIVFSLSVNVYLLKQVSAVGGQVTAAEKVTGNFNAAKGVDFWNKLVAYSRTHPDFAPVISKFSPALNETLLGNPGVMKQ
jgi:hypothetical protein